MAARPLLPIALRASKLCPCLPVTRGIQSHSLTSSFTACKGWQVLRAQELHRSSIFTLATGQLRKRPSIGSACDSQQWASRAGLRRKGFAQKPPDVNKAQEPSDTKKSPILSRIPLRTHENIYTIPNILTFSRLVAAPMVGYFLVYDHHATALALFAYAGITDLVDGYIARRYNLQTVVGTIIDPMADKLLMTISVACLAVNGSIPVWLAVVILGRDIGLALSAIYYRWISLPPPKTMARYWDFSLPSAEVKPTGISKVNTALQLLLVGSAMALPVLPETFIDAWSLKEAMIGFQVWKTGLPVRSAVLKPHAGRLVVWWVTTCESRLLYIVAATTIWSGLSYVFSKDAVKILTKEEVQKRIARAAAGKRTPP